MARGLAALRQQQEQYFATRNAGRLMNLWTKEGQTVSFRFMTSEEDVPVCLMIGVPAKTKAGKPFTRDTWSLKETYEDETPCPLFDKAVDTETEYSGPYIKPIYYVYVHSVFHDSDPKLGKNAEVEAKRLSDGTTVWEETVDEIRLFSPSFRVTDQIFSMLEPDPTDPDAEPVSLVDYKWTIKTTGRGQKKNEVLKHGTKATPHPEDARDALEESDPLMDAIEANYGPRGGIKAKVRDAKRETSYSSDDEDDEAPAIDDLEEVGF